jgi:hypothetical protein
MSVLQEIALIQLPPDFDPEYDERVYREQLRKRMGITEIDGVSIHAQMFEIPLDVLYPAQPLHDNTPSTP